jgi:hypothetical protein
VEIDNGTDEKLPPVAACAAAAVAMGFGVLAAIDIVAGLILATDLNLNFGVLIWFVGTGILNRSRPAWRWGQFLSGAGSAVLAFALGHAVYRLVVGEDAVSDPSVLPTLIWTVVVLALSAFCFSALRKASVKAWFEADNLEQARNPAAKKLIWPVVIVSLFAGIGAVLSEWSNQQQTDAIFGYHVTIFPYDEESGDGLKSMSVADVEPRWFVAGKRQRGFQGTRASSSATAEDGGMGVTLSGLTDRELHLMIGADGYESKSVTIGRDESRRVIRLPLKAKQAEQVGD